MTEKINWGKYTENEIYQSKDLQLILTKDLKMKFSTSYEFEIKDLQAYNCICNEMKFEETSSAVEYDSMFFTEHILKTIFKKEVEYIEKEFMPALTKISQNDRQDLILYFLKYAKNKLRLQEMVNTLFRNACYKRDSIMMKNAYSLGADNLDCLYSCFCDDVKDVYNYINFVVNFTDSLEEENERNEILEEFDKNFSPTMNNFKEIETY